MSETVTGYIDHVIFRNEDNGYTVMVLKGMEEEQELTCVGTFPAITQGAAIEASGNYTTHPVYGKQFQISSYVEKMPEDALAMERYLGSGAIKGIGAALAARIVRRFGDDTMRIVEEEPERLAEIKGISEKKAMEIAEQMTEKADMRRAMIFLQKYGISLNLGAKIYQKYGQTVYGVLQENPYRLAEDISGVGFRIADEIASRIGIHTDSDYRIRSGMLYTLLQASGEGHIYLPKEELFSRASGLLGVDSSYMEKHLMDMIVDRKLILKETEEGAVVYPTRYYYLELNSARMLCELNILCPEDEEMVELRVECGPKDIENGQAVLCRRDTREKYTVSFEELADKVKELLDTIQHDMLERARAHREAHTYVAKNYEEFGEIINSKPGFIKAMWCGDRACEDKIKEDFQATSRCMPFEQEQLSDVCVCCGKPAKKMVYWGRAY